MGKENSRSGLVQPGTQTKAPVRDVTKRRPWELYGFRTAMWLVVIYALVAVAWKARSLTPSAVPLHYLFISAAVASALVLILPALLCRISEVSFAGVKVVLAQ